jgi:hypothetical protein
MVSAETRAGLLTLAGVFASSTGIQIVDTAVGLSPAWRTVTAFVLFTGFGFVLPQLYLPRVEETVPVSYRREYVLLIGLFFGTTTAGSLSSPASVFVWILVGLAVVVFLSFEIHAGYRSVAGDGAT